MEPITIIILALAAAFLVSSMFGDSKKGQDRGELFYGEK